jgi:hypothetical protein
MNKKSLHTEDKSNKKKSKSNIIEDLLPGCVTTIELLLQFARSLSTGTLALPVRYPIAIGSAFATRKMNLRF